ncbi:SCO4848 family membrane protein [Aeromicrobium sp. UC242_57]|uniref:SCO4848 family membrane protein n=1 Tax=Aeromicrobium sp. UC242_57 TaxID=3374624 RepID=UPI0037BA0F60
MDLPIAWSLLLLVAGLWNVVIWPQFWRRIVADERSRTAAGGTTTFYRVHAVIIGLSFVLGIAVLVLGILTLF